MRSAVRRLPNNHVESMDYFQKNKRVGRHVTPDPVGKRTHSASEQPRGSRAIGGRKGAQGIFHFENYPCLHVQSHTPGLPFSTKKTPHPPPRSCWAGQRGHIGAM